jgi:peptidoglycan/xylan/chitin deacetylase (PgdA/CDA1 family)
VKRSAIAAAAMAAIVAAMTGAAAAAAAATSAGCPGGTVYLTLDTGNMREAERIAAILGRHGVRATFFLANERTPAGDHALDAAWAPYWRARAAEGHAFGSHTYDHVYLRGVGTDGRIVARPQFGDRAGRTLAWDGAALCAEIDRVRTRFRELTGRELDPWWRAPGGRAPDAAMAAAKACGWAHVHWAPAGFLGDELPSDRYPNEALLAQALRTIRGGDILIAHLGIWSRKDPWAPTLDPLIAGLRARGLCFATLRDHPDYRR